MTETTKTVYRDEMDPTRTLEVVPRRKGDSPSHTRVRVYFEGDGYVGQTTVPTKMLNDNRSTGFTQLA